MFNSGLSVLSTKFHQSMTMRCPFICIQFTSAKKCNVNPVSLHVVFLFVLHIKRFVENYTPTVSWKFECVQWFCTCTGALYCWNCIVSRRNDMFIISRQMAALLQQMHVANTIEWRNICWHLTLYTVKQKSVILWQGCKITYFRSRVLYCTVQSF